MNKEVVNTRTGAGAGIGAALGFLFGGPFGAAIGALVGGGVAHASGDPGKGVMTPRRKLIYARAMETIKDPAELRKLADAYAGEGLGLEATMLRKRAALRELPDDTKEKRRAAFRKAMACDKPEVIAEVAQAFHDEGAIDAAKTLRDHAEAVRAAHTAGKSAKPLTGGSQAQFADKLAKAIIHFGPASSQAQAAAANLIQARGKAPTAAFITEVIKVAAGSLKVDVAAASGPPAHPIEINATGGGSVEGAPGALTPEAADASAPEPTVIGPAAGPVEPQVIGDGVPPDAAPPDAAAMAAEDKRLRDEQAPEPEP